MMNSKKININSLLLALLIISNFLVDGFSNLIFSIDNLFVYFNILLFILSILNSGFKINKKILFLFIVLLFQFVFSFLYINSEMTKTFFLCFASIAVVSVTIASKKWNMSIVFIYIQKISLIYIPYYISLFTTEYNVYNAGRQMGIAYSLLPILFSAFILLLNKCEMKYKIIYVLNISLVLMIEFKLMTRGMLACVLFFLMVYMFKKIKKNIHYLKKYLLITLTFLSIIPFFINRIISSNWFYYMFVLKQGDFLNGREGDFEALFRWKGIQQLVFGSGIGSFKKNEGNSYIHNIIGQVFYEHGIILAILLLIVILLSLKIILKEDNEKSWMIYMLFSITIIRLMLSYYFWIDVLFWIYLAIVVNYIFSERKLKFYIN